MLAEMLQPQATQCSALRQHVCVTNAMRSSTALAHHMRSSTDWRLGHRVTATLSSYVLLFQSAQPTLCTQRRNCIQGVVDVQQSGTLETAGKPTGTLLVNGNSIAAIARLYMQVNPETAGHRQCPGTMPALRCAATAACHAPVRASASAEPARTHAGSQHNHSELAIWLSNPLPQGIGPHPLPSSNLQQCCCEVERHTLSHLVVGVAPPGIGVRRAARQHMIAPQAADAAQ